MILDTNYRLNPMRIQVLKALGYDTVGRYIAYGIDPAKNEKIATVQEMHDCAAAGLKVFLIYEISGNPKGADVGKRDGTFALAEAQRLGAPKGTIIWYTEDRDVAGKDMPDVIAAFKAFNAAVRPMYRTGCYGCGYTCHVLYTLGIIVGRWLTCSMGFNGTKEAIATGEYEMLQYLPKRVAGLDTDPDNIHVTNGVGADIGAFIPYAVLPETTTTKRSFFAWPWR
jgi:hypothetical protein